MFTLYIHNHNQLYFMLTIYLYTGYFLPFDFAVCAYLLTYTTTIIINRINTQVSFPWPIFSLINLFASMDPIFLFLLLLLLLLVSNMFAKPIMTLTAQPYSSKQLSSSHHDHHITIVGAVYCDICYTNSFSRHSYFLPGVVVHIQCKLEANSARTTEEIALSVNRTTDRYGMYKLEIPYVDGIDCVDQAGPAVPIQSFCQARLIGSSSNNNNKLFSCNVPGLKTISSEIKVKSKQSNLCVYSLRALSYRPSKKNLTLCGNQKEVLMVEEDSFNSSKFFLPYFPPYGFLPWPPLPPLPSFPPFPPLPQLPPLPPLPPIPSFPPFPPFPYFPFPYFPFPPLPFPTPPPSFPFPTPPPSLPFPTPPPSLPFPFPPLPPFTPIPPFLSAPPPPAFNLGDPRTWRPNIPLFSPPPPPPPPPEFNLRDPRTWIPYIPPSPPNSPHNQLP